MAHSSSSGRVGYIVWPRIVGSHKNAGIPFQYLVCSDARGGNLSTDSPVRRQKRFQSALRKFQNFTGSLGAGTFSLGGVMREGRCCYRWHFGHVCPAVGCPARDSRRPGLGWCPRSISERRNWLFPLDHAAVQGLFDVAQESRLSPSGDVLL